MSAATDGEITTSMLKSAIANELECNDAEIEVSHLEKTQDR